MKLKTFFPCLTWMCPFQYAELCCIYSEPIAKCLVWNTGLMSPETGCWSPRQPKELCLVPSWKKAFCMLNSGLKNIAGCFFIYLTPHFCLQLFPNTFEKKTTTTKIKRNTTASSGLCFFINTTYLPFWIHLSPHRSLKISAPDSRDPSTQILGCLNYHSDARSIPCLSTSGSHSCYLLLLSDVVTPTYSHLLTESLPETSQSPGLPTWLNGIESACQCRRCRRLRRHVFNPWVGKIPWNREWQPITVFLSEKLHGQRNLVG